jgi:ABC-type nitrate/sulfonate/bicarbonate transport system substrate-binding protein
VSRPFASLVAGAAMACCLACHPALALDTLRVGTPEGCAFVFALLDVGMGAGIFARHGLAIQKINFAGGGKLDQGMASGAIDLSISGNAELAFIVKGEPEQAVAAMAGAPVDMTIIVRDDKNVTRPADLKGKTIGVTSATSLTSYLALAFSEREGWGLDGVKRAYIGAMSSAVPALLVKNVDAIVGPVEGGLILAAQGKAHSILSTHRNALIYKRNSFLMTVETRPSSRQNFSLLISKEKSLDSKFARFRQLSPTIGQFFALSIAERILREDEKDRQHL